MWFGETSLLKREPRPNNVVSETPVDLLLLDRSDLTTILGPLQTILDAQAANFGPTSVKKVLRTKSILPRRFDISSADVSRLAWRHASMRCVCGPAAD